MAFLTVVKQWVENIWRVELTTRWAGGEDGTANIQAKQLAARTEYLKDFADEVEEAREGEGSLLARINKSGVEPMKIMAKFKWADVSPVAASTENVNVATGGIRAVDGKSLSVGNPVLLKNQNDKRENGIWQVQTGAWNRFPGYQAADQDCLTYKLFHIEDGDTNGGLTFFLDKDVYVIGESELIFAESLFSSRPAPGKVLIFDQNGESELGSNLGGSSSDISSALEKGQNLLEVFRVETIAEAMAEIHRRCNNSGEIDNTKIPDFKGIMIGDYLDLPSLNDGTTNFIWSDEYKNLRILVSGFNIYKGAASTENVDNHILFSFRNCVTTRQMNTTDSNTGGYASTAMKTYLEGGFAAGLRTALGGDYLYPVSRLLSISDTNWGWDVNTVFLPTEYEVWGAQVWSKGDYEGDFQCQWPIFRETVYKGKKHNGSRMWYWEASRRPGSAYFCVVTYNIGAYTSYASSAAGGVAPAFCVR
ncbi:MAG: hypothetical protein LBU82_00445 [Treponema sp.]|jgi:hypothetical protein|nr:hypothetical protein [Treponema sp.]